MKTTMMMTWGTKSCLYLLQNSHEFPTKVGLGVAGLCVVFGLNACQPAPAHVNFMLLRV